MALEVKGKVSLDGSGFNKTIGAISKEVQGWGGKLTGMVAGAFSIGAVIAFGKSIVDRVLDIKHMSEQFGITTDEVQKLQHAAASVGLEFPKMAEALSKVGASRKAAAEGDEDARRAFAKLGVSYRDLQDPAKRNVDLVYQMSTALKDMKMSPETQQAMAEVFGESGTRFIELLVKLNDQGGISLISKKDIDALAEYNRHLKSMTDFAGAQTVTKGMGIVGFWQGMAGMLKNFYGGNRKLGSDIEKAAFDDAIRTQSPIPVFPFSFMTMDQMGLEGLQKWLLKKNQEWYERTNTKRGYRYNDNEQNHAWQAYGTSLNDPLAGVGEDDRSKRAAAKKAEDERLFRDKQAIALNKSKRDLFSNLGELALSDKTTPEKVKFFMDEFRKAKEEIDKNIAEKSFNEAMSGTVKLSDIAQKVHGLDTPWKPVSNSMADIGGFTSATGIPQLAPISDIKETVKKMSADIKTIADTIVTLQQL